MVRPLPCCGEGCLEGTRRLLEEALSRADQVKAERR